MNPWIACALACGVGVGGYMLGARAGDENAKGKWQILRATDQGAPPITKGATVTLHISRGGPAIGAIQVEVTRVLSDGQGVGRVLRGPAWGPPLGFGVQFHPNDVATSVLVERK